MKYLFDTDHITFIQHGTGREYAAIQRRSAAHPRTDFAFSVVSFHEQVLGGQNYVNRAKSVADVVRGYDMLTDLLLDYASAAAVLRFDALAAGTFDRLRAASVRVATFDLRIASIALANNLTLLTRNAKDFGKVPSLVIEDWTV